MWVKLTSVIVEHIRNCTRFVYNALVHATLNNGFAVVRQNLLQLTRTILLYSRFRLKICMKLIHNSRARHKQKQQQKNCLSNLSHVCSSSFPIHLVISHRHHVCYGLYVWNFYRKGTWFTVKYFKRDVHRCKYST